MASNTITTTVTVGVELGGPTYGSDLTITATGAVQPSGTLGTTAIYGSSGTLVNNGSIIGGAGTVAGDGVSLSLSAIINAGTITGGVGATAGTGVRLIGGTLTNSGDIIGGGGGHGVGVSLTNGTLIESGKISAGNGGADAVHGSGNFLLVVDPGASFDGAVQAAASTTSTLQLGSGVTTGTLDMGGSFTGFSSIDFDSGATWNLEGQLFEFTSGQTIEGFTLGDKLTVDQFAATSASYITGAGDLILSDQTTYEIVHLNGSFADQSFTVRDDGTNSTIALVQLSPNNSHTIDTSVATSVTLGGGTYASPLTITNTGKVAPANGVGVVASAGKIFNDGTILAGANPTGSRGSGYVGVDLSGGTLENSGFVFGGLGYNVEINDKKTFDGSGGVGVSVSGGLLLNTGFIRGGYGVNPPNSLSVAGDLDAFGLKLTGGTVLNSGVIHGGYGAAYSTGGSGAYETAGFLENRGTILGAAGSAEGSAYPEIGGNGVDLGGGGSLLNEGLIMGALGATASVDMFGGTLTNAGSIEGGVGLDFNAGPGPAYSRGGDGVDLSGGRLINQGTIAGGTGSPGVYAAQGGDGVDQTGGTLLNYGLISGTYAHSISSGHGNVFNQAGDGITLGLNSELSSGTVFNFGTISGGNGGNNEGGTGTGNNGVKIIAGNTCHRGHNHRRHRPIWRPARRCKFRGVRGRCAHRGSRRRL